MIAIAETSIYGFEEAIRGMRNPMNSWDKSDSSYQAEYESGVVEPNLKVGTNDLNLMKRLRDAGTDHRKFMRMITVYCDINAPLYWWKEFDTYKVGTVANSCSTMHKLAEKEFEIDDFSHEHLIDRDVSLDCLEDVVRVLNVYRDLYLERGREKSDWWQMIQLLPSSYNQMRTVMMNYEVLANVYKSRRNHKLDEWHQFCGWVETLPYSELIVGEKGESE